jgi:hypothetical protein
MAPESAGIAPGPRSRRPDAAREPNHGDHARVDAYYLTAFGAAGQNTPLRIAAVGRSVDELVRVDGRWLIRSRNVAPQD